MNGVRVRSNAQMEADSGPIAGLAEWIKRQPDAFAVNWAPDVEQRVAEHLRRGMRFSVSAPIAEGANGVRPGVRFRVSSHLPEGTVAAFNGHGVLLAMAVL